ncbi:sigma-54-dependent transcriptional regulator [Methylotenera versatilis]|uniref:sigma-54-dependent transcriptional regulator n=1 Tax=Methylotenera versatilis TaxID=1055487 RepID=UPI0006461789|nr:sigma-54 dependent transcriptional regulator [Methylotenera versatilis]
MTSRHILVVDDEIGIRELLRDILEDEGHHITLADNAQAARDARLKQRPDLVLLDIWMPDCDGISLLKEWGNAGLLTMPVVMMSGHGTIDTAVEATRIGAFDFLEKPIALQKLLKTVATALKHAENLPKTEMNLASFGKSLVINELKQRLEQISRTKNALLLIGKKGGSVELCARFLHTTGTPWLSLIEYEKLASAPLEILEQTREGVLYIDEVSALNKSEQKGLQLLLSKADKYQVRVVCASAFSLPQLTDNAQFDYTLMQTLSQSTLKVPALNDHKEDIPDLATAMASLLVETSGADYKSFDIAALNALRNAEWPGDLAELEAVVQNAMLSSLTDKITLNDVNRVLEQFTTSEVDQTSHSPSFPIELIQPLREARDDFERYYFQYHMKLINNNMSKLAEISGLERTHLYRKLKQLGIKIKG